MCILGNNLQKCAGQHLDVGLFCAFKHLLGSSLHMQFLQKAPLLNIFGILLVNQVNFYLVSL